MVASIIVVAIYYYNELILLLFFFLSPQHAMPALLPSRAASWQDGFIRSLRSVAATDVHLHKDVSGPQLAALKGF